MGERIGVSVIAIAGLPLERNITKLGRKINRALKNKYLLFRITASRQPDNARYIIEIRLFYPMTNKIIAWVEIILAIVTYNRK